MHGVALQIRLRSMISQILPMKRTFLIYGLLGGLLITLLKWSEYRFLVVEQSFQIYGALVACIFAGLGIWLGLKVKRGKGVVNNAEAPLQVAGPFVPDEGRRNQLGITPREMEILALVAQGMTNREIAARLFVSENTVKTHCSRAFDKLGAKRRTQAVHVGKELGLLP